MTKCKNIVPDAQRAVAAATEDGRWKAHEAALDGASPELLVKTINGSLTEPWKPRGGWRVR